MSVDLKTGIVDSGRVAPTVSSSRTIFGLVGMARLQKGCALVAITGAEKVAILRGAPVFKLTSTLVLEGPLAAFTAADKRYVELLKDAVDPKGSGRGLFFSYGADLTLTQQRVAILAESPDWVGQPLWKRADTRFFWNRKLALPFMEAGMGDLAIPMLMGSVQQMERLQLPGQDPTALEMATLTLIARRSTARAGVRHWRRGADPQGNVANFVETEQLIEFQGPHIGIVACFIQLRGSIPLLWSQLPNIRYKPTTRLAPPAAYTPAFDRHFSSLVEDYKGVVAINLANQSGSEGVLSKAFEQESRRFSKASSGMRLVPFDFHKQCGATRYDRLSLMWKEVQPDFEQFGWYLQDADGVRQRQRGVFRTNCIDCLDRTNVVQGLLARHHLEAVLHRLRILPAEHNLPSYFPGVEQQFKHLWADHGDDISRQYAGTGALKSGFTRYGKRDTMGLLDDGVKSGVRYYLNNFKDGKKQDAIDFITGNYAITAGQPAPFQPSPSPTLPGLLVLLLVAWSLYQLELIFTGYLSWGRLFQGAMLPLALAGVILLAIVQNGKVLVTRPQLCPKLSHPW
ncbi:hypothetical protein WJX84_006665 [Apatococcus fuscideae]|uniref:SAC domain-containing protein n=1 Tax=Apatococcus fuscideae TaxID=2026836 RepID=A0AAW1T7D1_9CHLO